jgi:hypothetical protein
VAHSLKPAALPRAPARGASVRASGRPLPPTPPAPAAALPPAGTVAKSGFALLPSESEPDSDAEHSLDRQQYGHKEQQLHQQQQQRRLVDDDELAQQIAARMARHRIKQRRSVSWQGPGLAGASSGFSVGNRLH